MVKLHFEKIYNTDRNNEPCYVGFPLAKGVLSDIGSVYVTDSDGNEVPSQNRATGYWEDGSVKWVFTRFNADILGNEGADYICKFKGKSDRKFNNVTFEKGCIKAGVLELEPSINSEYLFKSIKVQGKVFKADYISTPIVSGGYVFKAERWKTEEIGAVCAVAKGYGYYEKDGRKVYRGECTLTVYRDKPWFELACRIINTTYEKAELTDWKVICNVEYDKGDSVRTTTAQSNYKTKFDTSDDGEEKYRDITAQYLMNEANEHYAEVFYGTFFADVTNKTKKTGLCATVFQAQQYFPKAVSAEKDKLTVFLVPKDKRETMQRGMAITQRILFHFHQGADLQELNNRSTVYQMPDKPLVSPDVFEKSGVFPNIFTKNRKNHIEIFLTGKSDEHSRAYGLMNWGDTPDMNYTQQGRGGGNIVWSNNEYDYPHSMALMYVRTGIRRYLDYVITSCRHWQDVDVCHFSDDPLELGGQYEHTNGHSINGKVVCSHQWVEGLLDYYHFTNDSTAYETAMGIAENVTRLLDTPQFKVKGETSARETGWALRSLTAAFIETNDEKWLEKCGFIVEHFVQWEKEQGHWLSNYMDNVSVRVVFMIAVAVGSLMRYNRVRPQKLIEDMIIRSIDDLIQNSMLDNGLFYYKELPSLKRLGNNPIILEALSIAYEITGDEKYLKVGIPTLNYAIKVSSAKGVGGIKHLTEGSVITGNTGTKGVAQLMLPVLVFYTLTAEKGLL